MTKIILFFITLFLVNNSVCGKNELTENEKIYSVCKVWGFLKYYHPNTKKQKIDWDDNLLYILPQIEHITTKKELSTFLVNWIKTQGEIEDKKEYQSNKKHSYFDKNFNLSWTQDTTLLEKELSGILKRIEENRFHGKRKDISITKAGNVSFESEELDLNFDWTSKNLRILSLIKYWNSIEYFFPYKYLTDNNWDLVLKKMIPKFSDPKTELDYHLAMLELVVNLDDSHAGFRSELIDEYFGDKFIPANFIIIDHKAVITKFYNDSLANLNELYIGDEIVSISEISIEEVIKKNFSKDQISLQNWLMRLIRFLMVLQIH